MNVTATDAAKANANANASAKANANTNAKANAKATATVTATARPGGGKPERASSPRLDLPRGLVNLPVPGHQPAVFVSPRGGGPPPWPVTLILHGNFDRPEWECQWWMASAAPRGWILCPRGIPRTDVSRSHDRWTYAGSAMVVKETHAALDALAARFPGLLRENDALFVGFSLGAILAAPVMLGSRLRFAQAALVEGGDNIQAAQMRALGKRGLSRVAFLCGQHSGCQRRAQPALRSWKRAGVEARLWIMPRAGHGYSEDFDPLGKEVVTWLVTARPADRAGRAGRAGRN